MNILNQLPSIPDSVNPMIMSDDEFAKFRQIGDDDVGTEAAIVFTMLDHKSLYYSLSSLKLNKDQLDLTNLVLNKESWDAPEESKLTWKNVAETFLEDSFNDPVLDKKRRKRKQLFVISDEEKVVLNNAAKFYCCHMTEATLALAVRSLLKQYAAFNSTSVLIATKLLPDYPHRRIISTMQFVMDVMDINSFEPTGRGFRAIQKLRLIHAMIRERLDGLATIHNKGPKWESEKLGVPINQQDMIFAIHTFSIEVIKGIIASGKKISEADIANYYYAWHIIGRLLGISSKLNPTEYKIGEEVQNRIYEKEFIIDNPNGTLLAKPLIQFLDQLLPGANEAGVLGIVKLFNDKQNYKPIFNDILKLDLSKSNSYYVILYKIGDTIRIWVTKIRFFLFTITSTKANIIEYTAKNQYRMMSFIIDVERTWSDSHFRIADGYGKQAALEDLEKTKHRPSFWKRVWHKIKSYIN